MYKKTSDIWQYCTVLDKTHAKCSLCKQRLSYKSSITNIKRHLARKHPDVCQYVVGSPYQYAETIEIKPSTSDTEATYEIYNENENAQTGNDYDVITTETTATTCGTFHILPKVVSESEENNEPESQSDDACTVYPRKETRKQKTSDIWQHCTVIDKVYAKCNICEAVLSYRTSITNIKKHLARKHMFDYPTGQPSKNKYKKTLIVYENEENEQASTSQMQVETPPKTESISEPEAMTFLHTYSRKKDPASLSVKNRLDNKLLDIFIRDYQSFRIVEEVGFRSFVRSLNSSYVMPSRQQIMKSLSIAYSKCLVDMKEHAQEIKECCLTTECWTSITNENFLAVTVHFIDEEFTMKSILLECVSINAMSNVSRELQRITEEWGVDRKILMAVSDHDVSVEAAMTELKWNYFSCFAHTINYLVQDALSVAESLLEKVKSIVFHFKTNADANSKLEIHQRNTDSTVKPKKVMQDDGRWNSSLRMLERLIELEEAIKETSLLYQDINLPQLSLDEWKLVRELCHVLKPFETVTNFISSERYTSASLIIVLTKELDDALQDMLLNEFTPTVGEILSKLKTGLYDHLGNVETSETLALCTYLDPRFKNLGFSSTEAAEATKEHLIELLSSKISEQTSMVTSNNIKTESTNESSFSIWQSFKKRVSECKQPSSSKSRAIIEVERYLEDELMDQQKNPLEWWKEYKGIYPCMSVVAQEVMCALGTSVPCDRIFSKTGYALNVRRSCLSGEEVKILTFLNNNSELFRKKVFDI